jgi:hypothetical protein
MDGLVYVSALAPAVGGTTDGHLTEIRPPPGFVIETGEAGLDFFSLLCGRRHRCRGGFLRDSQVPINMAILGAPVIHAAWKDKPSWVVVVTEDNAIDPVLLRPMAEEIGATTVWFRLRMCRLSLSRRPWPM